MHLIQCSCYSSNIVKLTVSHPFFSLKVSNFMIFQLVKVKINRWLKVWASARITCWGTSPAKISHLFLKISYLSQAFLGNTTVYYGFFPFIYVYIPPIAYIYYPILQMQKLIRPWVILRFWVTFPVIKSIYTQRCWKLLPISLISTYLSPWPPTTYTCRSFTCIIPLVSLK